jgi:hypothetical protein
MRKLKDCAADQFEDEELKRPSPGARALLEPGEAVAFAALLRLAGAHSVPEV